MSVKEVRSLLKTVQSNTSKDVNDALQRIYHLFHSMKSFRTESDNKGFHRLTMLVTNGLKTPEKIEKWSKCLSILENYEMPLQSGGSVTLTFTKELEILSK